MIRNFPEASLLRIDLVTGDVTTIAGSVSAMGYIDGAGEAARFNWGDGTYLSASGTLVLHEQSGNPLALEFRAPGEN
jgi:hypothetical protein